MWLAAAPWAAAWGIDSAASLVRVLAFAVFDESDSHYFEANLARHKRGESTALKRTDANFRKAHLIYSINGLVEGNLPVLTMKKGERVRWYMFSTGNDEDVHTPHWHGRP